MADDVKVLREADPVDFAAWEKRIAALSALKLFGDLCDDDCAIDWDTAEECIEAGFVLERKVTKYDLAQPFAEDRGIHKGGVIFELTPLGHAVLLALRREPRT